MRTIGFIGYGNMGSVLLNSFLSSNAIPSSDVIVYNRTQAKLNSLINAFPDIQVVDSGVEVAQNCRHLFVCVGTTVVVDFIKQINSTKNDDLHVIIISGGLEISSVENIYNGKITKIMPTIVTEVNRGVTLVAHNKKVKPEDMKFLASLLGKSSKVKIIDEEEFESASDLTSCAPAFIAEICSIYIQSIQRKSSFSYDDAFMMFKETIIGTLSLLEKRNETTKQLVHRVATKGGATEVGIKILQDNLPRIFDTLVAATMEPHIKRKEITRKQFGL